MRGDPRESLCYLLSSFPPFLFIFISLGVALLSPFLHTFPLHLPFLPFLLTHIFFPLLAPTFPAPHHRFPYHPYLSNGQLMKKTLSAIVRARFLLYRGRRNRL